MIQKTSYIIQHIDGYFINSFYERVMSFEKATRFKTLEEANHFYREGVYRTPDPENYRVFEMHITYELGGTSHVQEERDDRAVG